MGVLGIVLLVMFIIVSILLVLMVVIQDEGSDSLGGVFAGTSNSAFGARSSSVLVKFTYVLGALFFVLAFGLALVNKTSSGNVESVAQKKLGGATGTEWWNAPAQSAAPGTTLPASGQSPSPAPSTPAAPPSTPATPTK
jgi:preprotein translocase subunit SecG